MPICKICGCDKSPDCYYKLRSNRTESSCITCRREHSRAKYGISNVRNLDATAIFHRNTSCGYRRVLIDGIEVLEHHLVWVRANGPIPTGYHIHHIDGDKRNNQLTNLSLVSRHAHMRLHRIEQEQLKRGKIPDGMRWCSHCNVAKSIDDFPRSKSEIGGHAYFCFDCNRKYQRDYYHHKTRPRLLLERQVDC